MSSTPSKKRRRGPDSSRTQNVPHLAVLFEKRGSGAQLHAGVARNHKGTTFCDLSDPVFKSVLQELPEFGLAANDPNFALYRTDGWRHRYAEAFLELNRGCRQCLNVLAIVGREAGYAPKDLT